MFSFDGFTLPVRDDLRDAYVQLWHHIASPGPMLTGGQRVELASYVRVRRSGERAPWMALPDEVLHHAATRLATPGDVHRETVRRAADAAGDAVVVEVISLVSMLSAVDGCHRALLAQLEPLPNPIPGDSTREVAGDLKQRRTHIPMPAGPIPVALDLLPSVGQVFQESFGPQYMTGEEMALDDFERTPGLNRAQMEVVSTRTSIHNECFY